MRAQVRIGRARVPLFCVHPFPVRNTQIDFFFDSCCRCQSFFIPFLLRLVPSAWVLVHSDRAAVVDWLIRTLDRPLVGWLLCGPHKHRRRRDELFWTDWGKGDNLHGSTTGNLRAHHAANFPRLAEKSPVWYLHRPHNNRKRALVPLYLPSVPSLDWDKVPYKKRKKEKRSQRGVRRRLPHKKGQRTDDRPAS